MKICAIICEYNPFHNGHLYQLQAAKEKTGCDFLVCLMSGNFVQRGEAAILGKYARARHAVLSGADAVVELPAVFSTSPAELFAKGAVKLLASVPDIKYLCFGCESGDETAFIEAARALNDEPKKVSETIKRLLKSGVGYAKARAEAWKELLPFGLLRYPNNILGAEYTRAILSLDKEITIVPVRRVGGGYADGELKDNFSSAAAIREALRRGERDILKGNLPPYVFDDLPAALYDDLDILEKFAVSERSEAELKSVCDCGEGLENALKNAVRRNCSDLVSALTSKRYTSARLRRILLQNLLNISEAQIRTCLAAPLYLRLLAVRTGRKELLGALSKSEYPLLLRAGDEQRLTGTAKECLRFEKFADETFALIRHLPPEEKNIFVE